MEGFEPPASWSQTRRSAQTELHQENLYSSGDRAAPLKAAGPGPETNLVVGGRCRTYSPTKFPSITGRGVRPRVGPPTFTAHKDDYKRRRTPLTPGRKPRKHRSRFLPGANWWARRDSNSHSLRRQIYSLVGSNPCPPAHLQLGLVRRFHVPRPGGHSDAAGHLYFLRRTSHVSP